MPRKKPNAITTRNESKSDRSARMSTESMVSPKTLLSNTPPAELKGNKIARETWKKIIDLQNETQAAKDGSPIITAFDERTLITYCKAVSEEKTLEDKLGKLDKAQESLHKRVIKIKATKENFKDFVSMWAQFNGLTNNFKGMSARLDAHRKNMQELARSMYLTPAARAGIAPPEKEPDEPEDEMAKLLRG